MSASMIQDNTDELFTSLSDRMAFTHEEKQPSLVEYTLDNHNGINMLDINKNDSEENHGIINNEAFDDDIIDAFQASSINALKLPTEEALIDAGLIQQTGIMDMHHHQFSGFDTHLTDSATYYTLSSSALAEETDEAFMNTQVLG